MVFSKDFVNDQLLIVNVMPISTPNLYSLSMIYMVTK